MLLMARELGLGGSERQLTEIAKSLDRDQFEPHVGCFHPGGVRGEELRRAGVTVVQFPVRSFYSPSTLAAALQMGRYLEQHQVRLVHTFDVPLNLFGVPTARAFRTPVVVSSQRAHRSLTPGVTRHLLRIADQIADAVVVNCEAMRRHLIDDEHVPPGRVYLCHNAIDTEEFRPLSGERPEVLRDAAVVIGVVGVMRPEKGLDLLLEAFRLVSSSHRNLKLLVVGSGPSSAEVEGRSRSLGIREHCIFEPATDQVADWIRAIDIFVLPSRSEALSNSLMEAMACGCAAVASRVGGNPELIRHGQTGLLFECGNAGELAATLAVLIEQPALRRELGDSATRFIHENFSISAASRRMGEIYSELLAAHSATAAES